MVTLRKEKVLKELYNSVFFNFALLNSSQNRRNNSLSLCLLSTRKSFNSYNCVVLATSLFCSFTLIWFLYEKCLNCYSCILLVVPLHKKGVLKELYNCSFLTLLFQNQVKIKETATFTFALILIEKDSNSYNWVVFVTSLLCSFGLTWIL